MQHKRVPKSIDCKTEGCKPVTPPQPPLSQVSSHTYHNILYKYHHTYYTTTTHHIKRADSYTHSCHTNAAFQDVTTYIAEKCNYIIYNTTTTTTCNKSADQILLTSDDGCKHSHRTAVAVPDVTTCIPLPQKPKAFTTAGVTTDVTSCHMKTTAEQSFHHNTAVHWCFPRFHLTHALDFDHHTTSKNDF